MLQLGHNSHPSEGCKPYVLERQATPDSTDFSGLDSALFGSSPVSPLPDAPSVARKGCAVSGDLPLLSVGLQTLVGTSEMLGHALECRDGISAQQDVGLMHLLQGGSSTPLRSSSQRPLFIVAPLDVLVTRSASGSNTCHIIEINGTGIAGVTNMPSEVVSTVMTSISELPRTLQHIDDPLILVASSGQESSPPVSRTMHEKMLYIEALRKGYEVLGRTCHVTNMSRLEHKPASMPASGATLVLGYMKQFRKHFKLDAEGRLMLMGRRVHAAINDRFVLNIIHQFDHKVSLRDFMGYNVCFTAGADKGVAYEMYNSFFDGEARGRFQCMAPRINFERAFTRDDLVGKVQSWLEEQPVLIKPQGTGCGHGIEFFFGDESDAELEAKVDAAIGCVASNYSLECGGLPFTVCEFLDTATVSSEAGTHGMLGHKFEMRIVVYRDGDRLKAFPSIAKVARNAYDPACHDKGALINNITTSAKESMQAGSEFMLPLCNRQTLALLGVTTSEVAELCHACTSFIRYVLDQVQDAPQRFGLPHDALPTRP